MLTLTPATLFMLNRLGEISPLPCWIVGILVTTLATVAVSTVSRKFIEVPCIRLGRIFTARRQESDFPAS